LYSHSFLFVCLLSDYGGYFYNQSTCTEPPFSHFNQTIVSTSIAVCQRLCNDPAFYELTCSGFFWHRLDQSCMLTSYPGDGETRNCSAVNALDHVMYFRRIRYVHKRPIYCTFDDDSDTGSCPLQLSTNQFNDKWVISNFSADVSTGEYGGSYISYGGDMSWAAESITPLLNTTNKCLLLFHAVCPECTLQILAVSESLTAVVAKNLSGPGYWKPYFLVLPPGIHRITLTAFTYGKQTVSTYGKRVITYIRLDDISIRPCADFKRECLLSPSGSEYMGAVSTSVSGDKCTNWGIETLIRNENRLDVLGILHELYDVPWQNATYCRQTELVSFPRLTCMAREYVYYDCYVPYCSCAIGWFRCPNGHCLPKRMSSDVCNRKTNYLKYDDNIKPRWVNISRPDENKTLDDPEQVIVSSNMNIVWQKLLARNDMSMTSFVDSVSHDLHNFMIDCRWLNDKNCASQFEARFTDMGRCYTFNANTTALIHSDNAGEEVSGIKLVINSESYEIIRNSGVNGIKIHLFDPRQDVELMSDHGIHISPGFYTAIGVNLEHAEYLEPPQYGACGSTALTHTTDGYSYSRCFRDKQTSEFLQRCNCTNYFMPGNRDSHCSTRQYFTCEQLNKFNNKSYSTAGCPTHCDTTTYKAALSFIAQSKDLIKTVDTYELTKLVPQLESIHEIHSRVDDRKVLPFFRSVHSAYRSLTDIEMYLNEKLT
jgi:hypothetical protein